MASPPPAPTRKLSTLIVDKPWGRIGIDPRFGADPARQVGEIWFEPPPGQSLDVMAKYLFTSERLSIQVHPDNATAQARGYPYGKDECWIILAVEPGAELGIGTVREVAPGALIDAARDGSIEQLIDWREAKAGQFIYNPAGTVHALGRGLTVLEVQQAVDLTYRLYDYGRQRQLHLEQAREVVRPFPHRNPADRELAMDRTDLLVDGPYFGVAWCAGSAPPVQGEDVQLLPIDCTVEVDRVRVGPGECALITDPAAISAPRHGHFVLCWSKGIGRGSARPIDPPGQRV